MLELLTSLSAANMEPIMAVSIKAQELPIFEKMPFMAFLTNSIFVALLVMGIVLFFASKATKGMTMVPHKIQNGFEFVIEFLYDQLVAIVGEKIAPKAFPLLATTFIFILVANYSGLIPGVGTMGWIDPSKNELGGLLSLKGHPDASLLRPPTADLNLTLGIALTFMLVWAWITFRETGILGFLEHTFNPKGGKGQGLFMGIFLTGVFTMVGLIELVSIAFRPVTLSLRLFGNIFAGETLLSLMGSMGDALHPIIAFLMSVALPLPFYFMELLVGLLQAVVFTLLCAVYIQLSTAHDEAH